MRGMVIFAPMSEEPTIANDLAQQGKDLHRAIDFGFQVEAFLGSDIGKFLIARAEAQVADATEQLKRVNPENPTQIRALQHNIQVAEDIQYWLADAIRAGYTAQDELIDQSH